MPQDAVKDNIKKHEHNQGQLIGILQDVQKEYNYLPKPALERVAKLLRVPLSRVYAVATFFKTFSLDPRGKHHVCVCMGTACHVRGAPRVLDEMGRATGLAAGQTATDLSFTLETVNCVGCCALGPVVVVNGEYHGKMDSQKASQLIDELKGNARENTTQE